MEMFTVLHSQLFYPTINSVGCVYQVNRKHYHVIYLADGEMEPREPVGESWSAYNVTEHFSHTP